MLLLKALDGSVVASHDLSRLDINDVAVTKDGSR
jgi:hypothetical protein